MSRNAKTDQRSSARKLSGLAPVTGQAEPKTALQQLNSPWFKHLQLWENRSYARLETTCLELGEYYQ
jgi:hypothetical protein